MRLAGTCGRHSNSAMPQEAKAARYKGLVDRSLDRSLKCAYMAKVMKIVDSAGSSLVCKISAMLKDRNDIIFPVFRWAVR